jgi:hypothetical protein
MKTLKNLAAVASIAAVHTGSIIFAQDAETVIPEIAICEAAPEIIECEIAPEIAVCPEPCIFPETPEICILPLPTEPPTEKPVDVDIHIDPGVEDPTDAEGPTDTEFTDGGEGLVDENEVVDSSDPNADNEVTTTVEDDSVDFENGVPIEWVKRGGSDGDSPKMYYYMFRNPSAGNPLAGNPAPVLEKEEAPKALARGLGQDDKAAAIKTKANAASSKILSEKNEPTALIKKGRVFLR